MTIQNILDSFEDYRLESKNDSIDIDKLKEVLPPMIQQIIEEEKQEIRDYLISEGYEILAENV